MEARFSKACMIPMALLLVIVMTASGFRNIGFFSHHSSSPIECTDRLDQVDHSSQDHLDDILFRDLNKRPCQTQGTEDMIALLNTPFVNSFVATIWQPPKSC